MDEMLFSGIARTGQTFRSTHAGYLMASQQGDGGFAGPAGPSDLYFVRFALQALVALGADTAGPLWRRAAEFLTRHRTRPRGVVDCYNLLQTTFILQSRGVQTLAPGPQSDSLERLRSCLLECRSCDGGFSEEPAGRSSPYYAFLAALCYGLMGETLPSADDAARSVLSCRSGDGGFAGGAASRFGQTNQTAAAVALLRAADVLDAEVAEASAGFLASMQAPDGGLRATGDTPCGDLMSTFTGLYALVLTGRADRLRLGQLGRFVRSLADPGGGFRPVALGSQVDVEYTYYGLGAVGLLAGIVGRRP